MNYYRNFLILFAYYCHYPVNILFDNYFHYSRALKLMKCYYANNVFNEHRQYSVDRFLMMYIMYPILPNTKTIQEMKMPTKPLWHSCL